MGGIDTLRVRLIGLAGVLALPALSVGCGGGSTGGNFSSDASGGADVGVGGSIAGGVGGSRVFGTGGSAASGYGGARGTGGASGVGGSGPRGTGGLAASDAGVVDGASSDGGLRGTGGSAPVAACSAPAPAPQLLTDFSPAYWMNITNKWGMAPFQGTKYSYASQDIVDGAMSTSMATVDVAVAQQNLNVVATVQPGGYAGFGLVFDQCATFAAYTGVRFSMQGTTGGCALELQVQTFDQRPRDQTPPGGCDRAAGASCNNYPVAQNLPPPPDATDWSTIDVPFTSLTGWSTAAVSQIVGLQWQLTVPPGMPACAANFRIDDIQLAL
jgi:hypothetical protein